MRKVLIFLFAVTLVFGLAATGKAGIINPSSGSLTFLNEVVYHDLNLVGNWKNVSLSADTEDVYLTLWTMDGSLLSGGSSNITEPISLIGGHYQLAVSEPLNFPVGGVLDSAYGIPDPLATFDPIPYNLTFEGTPAPVPVPATLLLLGSGILGLIGLKRRISAK